MTRRAVAVAACCLLVAGMTRPAAQSSSPRASKLFKDSRAHLAEARASGDREVTLVIAARTGGSAAVEAAIASAGGVVRARAEEIGYLRARVAIDRVETIAALRDVDAVALSITGNNFLANGEQAIAQSARPAADVTWLTANRYRPQRDLGVDALRAAHPTFDGRGITVGVLDGFVDPLLPAFVGALDGAGAPVRKLAGQINGTDPLDGDDPFWVEVGTTEWTGTPTVEGISLHLPPGRWRIGFLDEARFADHAYLRGDLNRDGNPPGAKRRFALALNPTVGEVRVDLDQDGDLRGEHALMDYGAKGDVGTLGHDDPATPLRESVGFTLTVHPSQRFVSVNLGSASHGTEITGALVASPSPDGLMEGVAPGASVVNVWQGSTTHGLIENARAAFRDPRVDLVVVEQNVFITMDYAIDDGRSVIAILLDRLVDAYAKPAFVPASNIPGPGQMNDIGLGARAFAVGAYEHRDSWWTFNAARVAHEHNVSSTGSFGPAGGGRLKPDFVAPTRSVTPNPAFLPGGRNRDVYALEPGRGVCAGTSCATPMAAGVATVLLSGARQRGLAVDVDRLRWALTASSRPLDLQPHAQGAGLLDADAAWRLLLSSAAPPRFAMSAPVQTALADLLETPGRGPGIFLRERTANDHRIRVDITRTSGPGGPVDVALRWRHAGVFAGPSQIATTLHRPVSVEFAVIVTTPGLHSAALELADPSSGVLWDLSMHAVAIPARVATAADHTVSATLDVRLPGVATLPIEVPPGTAALDLRVAASAPLRLFAVPPDRKLEVYFPAAQPRLQHVIPRPAPGVWLVSVWAGSDIRDRLTDRALTASLPVTFTAAALAAAATSDGDGVRVTNRGATASLVVRPSSLAIRYSEPLTLAAGQQRVIAFDVPEGAEWLRIAALPARDDVDVDLHLLQCHDPRCGAVRGAMSRRAAEETFVPRPWAGRWRAVVDVFESAAPVDVAVTWEIAEPRLGIAHAGDAAAPRTTAASWLLSPRTDVRGPAPARGTLVARLPVVSPDLEAPMWTAPAAARGMGFTQALDWFPLSWVDAPIGLSRVP